MRTILTQEQKDARPCRSCRHYDCMMSRGEPLPDHVVAYQDGVPYASTASSTPPENTAAQKDQE